MLANGELGIGQIDNDAHIVPQNVRMPFNTTFVKIAARGSHNIALSTLGQLFTFGLNQEYVKMHCNFTFLVASLAMVLLQVQQSHRLLFNLVVSCLVKPLHYLQLDTHIAYYSVPNVTFMHLEIIVRILIG